jgi:hypothetical protein
MAKHKQQPKLILHPQKIIVVKQLPNTSSHNVPVSTAMIGQIRAKCPFNYNPIDKSEKFTEVYLTSHFYEKFSDEVDKGKSELVAILAESPFLVFEQLSPYFHISEFGSLWIYDEKNKSNARPGVELRAREPVKYGVTGKSSYLLNVTELLPAQRKTRLTSEEAASIASLTEKNLQSNIYAKLDKNYKNIEYQVKELQEILNQFK